MNLNKPIEDKENQRVLEFFAGIGISATVAFIAVALMYLLR